MKTPCATCGMPCDPREFHPFAACLMFKACRSSETVRANLEFVQQEASRRAMERAAQEGDYWQTLSDRGGTNGCKCGLYIASAIRALADVAGEKGVGK